MTVKLNLYNGPHLW